MNKRVFALDDEREILDSYETLLGLSAQDGLDFFSRLEEDEAQESFLLETFTSGESYIERLEALYAEGEKLPLAILDMRLPGKHGLDIAKETREIDKDITIIIVSAYADHSAKELSAALDENIYYLHKPYREDELYLLINSSIKQWNNNKNQKSIEQELAIDSIEDGVWDWDLRTDEIHFSSRWKAMLGFEDDELEDRLTEWSSRVHLDDIDKTMEDFNTHLQKKTPYYINEHRLKCKDGSYKWILARGKAHFDSSDKAVRMSGFHTDITERKRLEEELLGLSKQLSDELEISISKGSLLKHTNLELKEKLAHEIELRREKEQMLLQHTRHAAMGEMINMIAHQWRQPLTAIGLSADNLLISQALDSLNSEELQESLELINTQVHYLSETINDFRDFFLPNKDKEKLLVHNSIEDALSIIEKILLSKKISLKKEYHDKTPLMLYRSELTQVVLNLIKNAQDNFEEKNIQEPYILLQTQESKSGVIIRVCDNGGGIKEEIRHRIFEPYFTTKKEQNGTGLGLYMSKMIIEEHLHGTINATNTDDGICFRIELPKPH